MSLATDPREHESIRSDLASGDDEIRRLAVERLLALPPREALARLVEALGDESWRVRKAVVERLLSVPESWGIPTALVGALADTESPARRNSAVEALVRCGERALPALLEATRSSDGGVRKLAVDALAGVGSVRATPRLVHLLDDRDANVRAAAADALAAVAEDECIEVLRRAAVREDEDPLVRFAALHGLAQREAPLRAAALGSTLDDPVLRPAAFAVLGRTDDPEAVERLLKGLQASTRSSREAAMEALLRILARSEAGEAERLAARIRETACGGSEHARDAARRLGEADLGTRLVLIQFLGLLCLEEVVRPVLLAGRDEALKEVVLATLERIGETAEAGIERAWSDLDTASRGLACELLGRTRGERGRALLLGTLDDAEPELRAAAARALGRRRAPEALAAHVRRLGAAGADAELDAAEENEALTEALTALARPPHGTPDALSQQTVAVLAGRIEGASACERHAIACVLGEVGESEHADLVARLLQDPSPQVRRAAVRALARIEAGAVSEPVRLALADDSAPVRIEAAAALAEAAHAGALDDLEALLGDLHPNVRAAAARAVGDVLARSAAPASAGAGREPDPEGPQRGARAPRARAVTLLERALDDDGPVALTAVEALQAAGVPEAGSAARRLLAHPDAELVQAAVRCLGMQADVASWSEVIALAGHPHWSVRAEAIHVLAERRVAAAIPAILRRLEIEEDGFVREIILRALARLEE